MDPSSSFPMNSKKISNTNDAGKVRWGIMGTGRVCNDFVQALKIVEGAEISSVCSRSAERAHNFASRHGIPRSHGSYEELAADSEVDIVYIGSLHTLHREHAEMSLNNGKHCLVEKPFTCTYEDAQFLIDLATQKNRFIMEGMWTRFFPTIRHAKELLNSGELGNIVSVRSDFGFHALSDNETPDGDMFQPEKGGGGAFYVSPYLISMATLGFGADQPEEVTASGLKGKTGIDVMGGVTLKFPCGLATLSYSLMAETEEETDIACTEGRIRVNSPFHCPTSLSVTKKGQGRGNIQRETFQYPLPEIPEAINESGGFVYPNSIGFSYEAQEVQRCILSGLLESPLYTHKEMLVGMKILSQIRDQIGVEGFRSNCNLLESEEPSVAPMF